LSAGALRRGRRALDEGDWGEARRLLRDAATASGNEGTAGTAAAWDGIGLASYWLDDGDAAIDAHEQAFAAYREAGERRAAARMAVWLVDDDLTFRGAPSIANGWLERAGRLLEGEASCPERAWLEIYRGHVLLMVDKDPDGARAAAAEALRLAIECGADEAELVAIALEGLARVSGGDVAGGMPRLDEASAAAITRDLGDLNAAAWACCYLIHGCEEVRDFPRAAEWCERVSEYCARHGLEPMFATCRMHYASVLTWQGRWADAEAELTRTVQKARASRPPMVRAGTVRLGELRRRQGAWDEAAALFGEAAGHPLATLGLANLALDRERYEQSADMAQRFLRGVPADHRPDRADGLLTLARASAGAGDVAAAEAAADELRGIAERVDTPPLQGAAAFAEGALRQAQGRLDDARRRLEDAVDAYDRGATPLESAQARIALSRVALRLGHRQAAIRESEAAAATLDGLGAAAAARAARDVAERAREGSPAGPGGPAIDPPPGETGPDPGPLSDREVEVLRLVAEGLSNREVGDRLYISPHTVKRHVANILTKMDLPSRAAAAAEAARRRLL
jgi:DNA-binding CsgD family transcriptional regulator/tetratricopeptide (TPR) repeat protein